jgi:hypothetical protein
LYTPFFEENLSDFFHYIAKSGKFQAVYGQVREFPLQNLPLYAILFTEISFFTAHLPLPRCVYG